MPEAKIRVLVVEDDLEQQEALVEWLEGDIEDIVVEAVVSGEAAFALLDQNAGDFDVVLLDQRLPGLDGIATMQRIKEIFPVMPVIMFTEFEPKRGMDALREGAYRYLPKPVDLKEVTIMVRHASELRQAAQLQMQLRLSERLRRASQDLGLAGDVDAVLRETFDYAFDLVGDTTGLILSVEQDQHLRLVDCRGVKPEQRDAFNASSPKADKGSFGIVVQSGDIFESADTCQDRAENRIVDFGLPVPAKVINLPIKRGKAVVAILVLDTLPPTIQVREALIALADIAGIALERLFERATLTALYEMGQEFTLSQNVEQLLDSIVKWTQEILGADAVVLYQYDSVDDSLSVPPKFAGLRDVKTISQMGEYHRDNLVLRLIREKKPYHYSSDAKHDRILNPRRPKGAIPTFVKREGIVSSGAVLLRVLDETVGVLFFNYRIHREFDAQERQKVQLFADQAAAAILNMRRYEREQSLRNQAETLQEVAASISSETAIERVAEQILDNLKRVANYTTASIQLLHGDRRKLLAASGFEKDTASPWLSRPISEDHLVAQVVLEKKPLVLPDTAKSELWDQSEETSAVKSWMGLPLIWGEDVIGILTLDHSQPGFFTEQSAASWMSFAQQAAIAIHNARLVERLQVLNAVGNDLRSELEPAVMFDKVVRAVVETLDCMHCTFFGLEGKELIPKATHTFDGSASVTRRFNLGKGLIGVVAEKGKPLLTRDAKSHPHFLNGLTRPDLDRSMILAPVLIEGAVFGVLSADQDRVNAFNAEDLQMLETLAGQLAAAIQNGKLLARERERADTLVQLQRVSQAINADPSDQKNVMAAIVSSLKEVFQGEDVSCAVRLFDPLNNAFKDLVSSQDLAKTGYFPPRKNGVSAYVIKTLQPLYIEDVYAPHVPRTPTVRPERVSQGVRAAAYLPLISEGRLWGRLSVYWNHPQPLPKDQRLVLELFANQAATAIKNANMHQYNRQQLETLEAIIGVIGSSEDPLPSILKGAATMFGAHYGSFSLADVDTRLLAFYAIYEDGKLLMGDEIPENKRFQSWDVGITGHVASTGESYRTGDVTTSVEYDLWYGKTKSELAVALRDSSGQVIGVLNLESPVLNAFDKEAERLCRGFADVAALAMEKARSFEIQRQLQELYLATQQADTEAVLQQILQGVNAIVGEGTSSSINLYDAETDAFGLHQAFGPMKEALMVPPRPDGTGRYVIRERKPLFLTDVRNPPGGYPTIREPSREMGNKSFAALPLEQEGEIIGVLFVNVTRAISFTTSLRRDLIFYAGQAAIAVNRVQLSHTLKDRQQKAAQVEAIKQISVAISEMSNQDEILGKLLESTLNLMAETSLGEIRLITGNDLVSVANRGASPDAEFTSILVGIGVTGWVAQFGKPQLIPDVQNEPRYVKFLEGTRSELAVPMKRGAEVIGVLNIEHPKVNAFTEDDLRLAEAMAALAAVAITNAELYQQIKQQRQQQTNAMANVSASIAVVTGSPEEILEGLLDATLHLMREASLGEVRLVKEENLEVVASRGEVVAEDRCSLPKTQGITGWVATNGESAMVSDVEKDQRYVEFLGGTHSQLAVPMKRGAEVIGVLNIEHPHVNAFTEDDLKLAEAMAALATVAITNAELYQQIQQQRREQTNAMANVSASIAVVSGGPEEMLEGLLDATLHLMREASLGEVRLVKKENLEVVASRGGVVAEEHRSLHKTQGITGWVATNGESAMVPDVKKDHRYVEFLGGTRSELAVPLKRGAEVIGVLNIEHPQVNAFTEDDLRLAEAMAALATVAITNAELYQETQRALERTQTLGVLGGGLADLEVEI